MRMPAQRLSGDKLDKIIAYLVSLSANTRRVEASIAMQTMKLTPEFAAKNGISHTVRESALHQALKQAPNQAPNQALKPAESSSVGASPAKGNASIPGCLAGIT